MSAALDPNGAEASDGPVAKPRKGWRGCRMVAGCGCLGCLTLAVCGVMLLFLMLSKVPGSYPGPKSKIPPPQPAAQDPREAAVPGFVSPYLGHTGSWDGKGGTWGGGSKVSDLDLERSMGLRWTFMPVYWSAFEPEAPGRGGRADRVEAAWEELDAFVVEALRRDMHILMQAPVVGGNAGGPPAWAGVRERGKSAPMRMDAVAAFAGRLAERYAPGGLLAQAQRWGDGYGVRAWELDNEPDGYRTSWAGQAADYAEFAVKVAAEIRRHDPRALIIGPGVMGGGQGASWMEGGLDAAGMRGSPEYRRLGVPHSFGPVFDAISFHVYEGLDSAFAGHPRTIEVALGEVQEKVYQWETRSKGFEYRHHEEFWHTEGNYDFLGVLSAKRRAAWRWQFYTRAFAAGVRKVAVMDPSKPEQVAIRAYVKALPDPFPMMEAGGEATVASGRAVVYRHRRGDALGAKMGGGTVWVLWAEAGGQGAEVEIPTEGGECSVVGLDGAEVSRSAVSGRLKVVLAGDAKMAPPILVVDTGR